MKGGGSHRENVTVIYMYKYAILTCKTTYNNSIFIPGVYYLHSPKISLGAIGPLIR